VVRPLEVRAWLREAVDFSRGIWEVADLPDSLDEAPG
jgi:hypothetical protein